MKNDNNDTGSNACVLSPAEFKKMVKQISRVAGAEWYVYRNDPIGHHITDKQLVNSVHCYDARLSILLQRWFDAADGVLEHVEDRSGKGVS